MAGINLVVSCSKRKTRPALPALHFRALPAGLTLDQRVTSWASLLKKHAAASVPARELYAGEHWQVVRSILTLPSQAKQPVKVWVCSAGYGLVADHTPLAPYSATFARREPDSVVTEDDGHGREAAWWSKIARVSPAGGGPRTIVDIARQSPKDFLFVALSDSYLTAVSEDLLEAADVTSHLAVLSVGGSVPEKLRPHFLQADARLRGQAGGTLSSLNARLARLLIQRLGMAPLTFDRCKRALTALLAITPAADPVKRRRVTDTQLEKKVRAMLKASPKTSPSRLLKTVRESGLACEQSRFTALFNRIQEGA